MKLRFVLASSLLFGLFACGDDAGGADGTDGTAGTADSSGTAAEPFDEAEVIERGAMFATELVKINDQPFPSLHGLANTVNVYVDAGAADLYRTLDPEAPVEVALPEGTLIVKEHLNEEGAYDGYLMMYRGPVGYSDSGDWFWARIDGAGATQETGQVGFCIGCHTPAPSFVFGVEADNQT